MLNLTPHAITLHNPETGSMITLEPIGTVARVSTTTEKVGFTLHAMPVIRTVYGEVENVPEAGTVHFIVSSLVLSRLGPEYSGWAFAPATGPNDGAIRDDKGRIVAVTKLVTV